MSAMHMTRSAQEARMDAWSEALHTLARKHLARREQRFAARPATGHHILDPHIAGAVEGGTDPGAASIGSGNPDAAPVHRRAHALRARSLG